MVNDTDAEVKYSLKVNLVSSQVNIIDAFGKTSLCHEIQTEIVDSCKETESRHMVKL